MKTSEKAVMAIGVDIGGTHITTALVNLDKGNPVPGTKVREAVNAHATAEEILNTWYAAIQKVLQHTPPDARRIGFAMPGPFDYENGISLIQNMHKYEALYGLNIKKLLSLRFDIDSGNIVFRNDTEAFLAGEGMGGVARGYAKAIGITLGTGLGSAKSNEGIAMDVNLGSSPFREGIVEDYLSTRWFVKRYRECSGQTIAGVKELLLLHHAGNNPWIHGILEEFYHNLASFLDTFIAAENPEVLVIGGNIAEAYDLFYPELKKRLRSDLSGLVIKKAGMGEDAALVGAVSCWMPAFIKA